MSRFVQAIIINNSSILCKTKYDENKVLLNQPISKELLEGETPNQALEKLINEQFNTSSEIIFKLSKELYGNTTTFLVNIDNIDSISEDFEKKNYRWVSLYDKGSFTYNEKLQLSNLILACVDNNYSPNWVEPILNMITSDNRLKFSSGTLISKIRLKDHKNMDSNTKMKDKILTIGIAIVLGFIYNLFFHSRSYGISYPLFTILVILVFLYFFRKKIEKIKPIGLFLLAITFILSLNFAFHSNIILNSLNIIAAPLLLTASFIIIRYDGIEWSSIRFVFSVFERIIPLSFENLFKPILFAKNSSKKRERGKLNPQTKSILIGLLVSIPLLIVILPLLSSADSVFGYYTANFYTVFTKINIGNTLWNVIRIVIVSLYLFGFFWSFRYSNARDTAPSKLNGTLEPITVLTVFIIINLVYLLFTVVQFSYLYGGMTALPNGFTYAEYARRGFFELILVTIINFTLLIASTLFTKKESALKGTLNAAYTLLVLFTFNMLFSAHFKMSLYESAFGYTYLRIFVHFFLLLLFILFVIVLAGIWINKIPVAKLSIIAALLMYLFINFVNVDSIIVNKNIERYDITGKIDVNYFTYLSYDVVPQVVKFGHDNINNNSISKKVLDYTTVKKKALNKDTKWFEFNYSKFMAKKALSKE